MTHSRFDVSPYLLRFRGPGAVFAVLATSALLIMAALPLLRGQAAEPATTPFATTWDRPDRPVSNGLVSRTWMWGPEAFTEGLNEEYQEAPGGERIVQYFDKSRMEITDPNGNPNTDWYVTNGLLVVELITGRMQTGNNSFEQRDPALVNVAGDADDPSGPTYSTFYYALDEPAKAVGTPLSERIDRSGRIYDDPKQADRGVTAGYYVSTTDHTIATPFWNFMNSSGVIYRNGQYITDTLFPTPYYATGLPITEAYWADVKVGGVYKDVLIQCFERRCLTYTPDNPTGWQVEAGNVGLHYYGWRYAEEGSEVPTPSPTTEPSPSPTSEPSATPGTGTPEPSPTASPTPSPTASPTVEPDPDPVPDSGYDYLGRVGGPSNPLNQLGAPYGVATSPDGDIVVIDDEQKRVQIYSPDGFYQSGFGGEAGDDLQIAKFKDVEVDSEGHIWILDSENHKLVKFDRYGEYLGEFGGYGSDLRQFDSPEAFTIGPDGYFYVADTNNYRVQVIDPNGKYVRGWGEKGSDAGEFGQMTGIAVHESGNVFVSDGALHRIQMFDPSGQHLLTWGDVGLVDEELLNDPRGLEIDDKGFLYVTDYGNDRVQVYSTDGEYTRSIGSSGNYPGQFDGPVDIAAGQNDNVYVIGLGDALIHTFTYRGEYLNRWGNDYRTTFGQPAGIVQNDDGYIYVADAEHGLVKIISYDGEFDGIMHHDFGRPVDVTFYNDYVYVLDAEYQAVLVFDPTGEFVDGWGNLRLAGVPDTGAEYFNEPSAIDSDADGYIYVVDSGNYRIQKFNSEGEYVTEWGRYGDGPADFKDPSGIVIWNNYVYVTDREAHRVQVFDRQGEYVGGWGELGDGYGYFHTPNAIAADLYGNIYVADTGNDRVQQFTYEGEYIATISAGNTDVPTGSYPAGIATGFGDHLYVTSDTHDTVYAFELYAKE